jgi:hypothetical protein
MKNKVKLCGKKVDIYNKGEKLDNEIHKIGHRYFLDNDKLSEKWFDDIYAINDTVILYSKDYSVELKTVYSSSWSSQVGLIKNKKLEVQKQYKHNQEYEDSLLNSLAVILKKRIESGNCMWDNNVFSGINKIETRKYYGERMYELEYISNDINASYFYWHNNIYKRTENYRTSAKIRQAGIGEPLKQGIDWIVADCETGKIMATSKQEIKFVYEDDTPIVYMDGYIFSLVRAE